MSGTYTNLLFHLVFSVSESQAPRVRSYIRNQMKHHRKQDFKGELLALLVKNIVEFDKRYIWD
jgi:hypothetical protein